MGWKSGSWERDGWNWGRNQWNGRNRRKWIVQKKVVVTGAYAINSEYIFRKGSDPMRDEDVIISWLLIG
jgi:hypothetical protein